MSGKPQPVMPPQPQQPQQPQQQPQENQPYQDDPQPQPQPANRRTRKAGRVSKTLGSFYGQMPIAIADGPETALGFRTQRLVTADDYADAYADVQAHPELLTESVLDDTVTHVGTLGSSGRSKTIIYGDGDDDVDDELGDVAAMVSRLPMLSEQVEIYQSPEAARVAKSLAVTPRITFTRTINEEAHVFNMKVLQLRQAAADDDSRPPQALIVTLLSNVSDETLRDSADLRKEIQVVFNSIIGRAGKDAIDANRTSDNDPLLVYKGATYELAEARIAVISDDPDISRKTVNNRQAAVLMYPITEEAYAAAKATNFNATAMLVLSWLSESSKLTAQMNRRAQQIMEYVNLAQTTEPAVGLLVDL